MAKLTGFIYCLDAERVPASDGKGDTINAVGIMSALTPEYVPGAFSFSIIFSILDINLSDNNTVRVTFSKDGEKDPLVDSGIITLSPQLDADKIGLPNEYKGFNLSMDFRNVIFETEGVYNTTIYFNNVSLPMQPIYVKGKR